MRLEGVIGIRINGKDAIEAKVNGHIVWSGAQPTPDPDITVNRMWVGAIESGEAGEVTVNRMWVGGVE